VARVAADNADADPFAAFTSVMLPPMDEKRLPTDTTTTATAAAASQSRPASSSRPANPGDPTAAASQFQCRPLQSSVSSSSNSGSSEWNGEHSNDLVNLCDVLSMPCSNNGEDILDLSSSASSCFDDSMDGEFSDHDVPQRHDDRSIPCSNDFADIPDFSSSASSCFDDSMDGEFSASDLLQQCDD
jgi:hypothetical protein